MQTGSHTSPWIQVSLSGMVIMQGKNRLSSIDICQGNVRNILDPDQRAMERSKPLQIDLARRDSLEE